MSRLFHATAGLLCILALPATLVLAQDACPATATCYEGHELVFDASDGSIQFLVVRTDTTVTTTLDGQTTRESVTLAQFVSDGDRFVFLKEFKLPKTGNLASGDVGDTFGLIEIGGGS